MRFVIQRVSEASVTIDGVKTAEIGKGYMVLIGIAVGDTKEMADKLVRKMIGLRIFEDGNGKTKACRKPRLQFLQSSDYPNSGISGHQYRYFGCYISGLSGDCRTK